MLYLFYSNSIWWKKNLKVYKYMKLNKTKLAIGFSINSVGHVYRVYIYNAR